MGQRGVHRSWLLASAALFVSGPAMAQQVDAAEDQGGGDIVVTGSRIAVSDYRSNSPLSTTDAEELRLQGTVNIEDALVEIPQATPGVSSTNNNGSNGTTTVNLRGLGDVRTLVLVDGKRWIPSGTTGVVDLNTIPVALIRRVEVVTGGASAVYGSDALGGVVNFIFNDRFEGFQVDANSQITERGDGFVGDANLTVGGSFAEGRGHVTLWGGYTRREAIFQGDRAFSRFALAPNRTDDGLIRSGSTTAFPANITLSAVANRPIDTDGDSIVSFGPNGALVGEASIFNTNPINYLQVPQERWNAGAMFRYELSDSIEAFGRFAYSNNRVSTQLAPSGTFFASFFINPDNPFLPPATINALRIEAGPAGVDANGNIRTQIGYRFASPRKSDFSRSAYQLQGGLRGDFGGSWRWEVFGQYARTEQQTVLTGDGNLGQIQQALLVRNVNGTPQCINPAGGCVPLNIFTNDPSRISPEALRFISLDLGIQATTEQSVFGASLSGDLGRFRSPLANNPIGVAVGVEYRDERSRYIPDANYAAGRSAGFGSQAVVIGDFNVKEIFGEIRIPLVENVPFIRSLTFEGGYRFSDYSTAAGSVETFKAGGDWAPVEDIRFRGLYQRAVRAPNINELFQPQVETAVTGNDPCAGPNPAASRELCEATGVPAGRYGAVPLPPAGQFQGFAGGNPNLNVETSDTYTIGVVLQPRFLPNFNFTADYYSVRIDDAIEPLAGGAQNALNACYLTLRDVDSIFCQQILRDPVNGSLFGGNETGVYATLVNTGRIETKGVDFSMNYAVPVGANRIRLNATATYVDSFIRQGAVGLPANECAGRFGAVCNGIIPRFKTASRISFDGGSYLASIRWRHLGPAELDRIALGTDANGRAPVERFGAYDYFDLDISIDVTQAFSLNMGVSNLFDREPPIFGLDVGGAGATANTYPGTYDALGRMFRLGVRARF
jgi:iron complex outermembrane receptor protein